MRKTLWAAAAMAAAAMLAAPGAQADVAWVDQPENLLSNGSFEEPDIEQLPGVNVESGGEWTVYNPTNWDRWELSNFWEGPGPEIQRELWTPAHGEQYVELDSHYEDGGDWSNSGMAQRVFLNAGEYNFSFWWAPRPNNTSASNILYYNILRDDAGQPGTGTELFFTSVYHFDDGNGAPRGDDPGWRKVWRKVTITQADFYHVAFAAQGPVVDGVQSQGDTLGAFVDAVSLTVVPVPPAAALGVLGMGIVAVIRRRKSAK
jgi:hypothetical protein